MSCDFISLLADNLDIVLSCVVGLLCFLVTLFRTGSVKKSIQKLKEYEEMVKYKVAEKQVDLPVGQKFQNTIDDFILDPATNELSKSPVPKDVQAFIQGNIDVALNRALERFMPEVAKEVDDVSEDYSQMSQDLAEIGNAFDIAEEYRERFGLDSKMSVAQIFAEVQKRAETLKQNLLNKTPKKESEQHVESETQKVE